MRAWAAAAISVLLVVGCRAKEQVATAPAEAPVDRGDQPERGLRVAVTFDDLPQDLEVVQPILAALERHDMPPVYWFVTGKQIDERPEWEGVLRDWVAAGNQLDSHTYSHPRMKEIGVDAYIQDIDANEPVLRRLVGPDRDGRSWRYFRFPFLEQGLDAESTEKVRSHLSDAGYRIAEVTIDFGDYAWTAPYVRCIEKKDDRSVEALEQSFLSTAWVFLGWTDEAARRAFGRPIPHVLLLHARAFTGLVLDDLLTLYEKQGVTWTPLDEALDDAAYRDHVPPDKTDGDSLIEQVIITNDADHPPWVQQPLILLDVVCR